MKSSKSIKWVLLSPLLVALLGCGKRLPLTYESPLAGKVRVCRVAVLPFTNETTYPLGGTLLYRIFLGEMVATGRFRVVNEGDVRRLMLRQRLMPGETPGKEFYRALVENLGVEALITGRVVEMEEVRKGRGVEPRVAFWLEVRDARSGKVVWSTYSRRRGGDYRKVMHFGVVNTVTALVKKMCDEVLKNWEKEGLGGCEEW